SEFRIVGQAIGRFTGDLRPGLYVMQYKAGRTVKEVPIAVAPGQASQTVDPPELTPRSAAPLAGTPAGETFGVIPPTQTRYQAPGSTVGGDDGPLFVFVRDNYSERAGASDARNRLGDLEIFAFEGAPFAGQPSVTLASYGRLDPNARWYAGNIVLPAGAYGVR